MLQVSHMTISWSTWPSTFRYASRLQEKVSPRLSLMLQNTSLLSVADGSYIGLSSCNQFTSMLGSGQNVLSYAYFTPWSSKLKDGNSDQYYMLLEPLAVNISKLYPGWRMRIYHNITEDDEVFPHMCDLYCNHPHVDTCDMRQHPTEGDLQDRFPAGMMWRFLVISNSMKFN